jgi:hypothetical protein
MSRSFARLPTCRCRRGITATFTVMNLDEWSPRFFVLKSSCSDYEPNGVLGKGWMKYDDEDELWQTEEGEEGPLAEGGDDIVFKFDPTGRLPGQAEVIAYTRTVDEFDVETLTEVARWENRTWFDPHGTTAMRLKTATTLEGFTWAKYACLIPDFDTALQSCCGKDVLLAVTIPEMHNHYYTGPGCGGPTLVYYLCGFNMNHPSGFPDMAAMMQGNYLLDPGDGCVSGGGSQVVEQWGYDFTTQVGVSVTQSGDDIVVEVDASITRSGTFGSVPCGGNGNGGGCLPLSWSPLSK